MTTNKRERRALIVLSATATILVVYITVRLSTIDSVFSVVPGWHTTIYPTDITWSTIAALIIVTGLVAYVVFRGIFVSLTLIRKLFKKLS